MNSVLLMQVDDSKDMWSLWTNPGSNMGAVGIFAGILVLVVMAIFFWAGFVRKPRKRLHSYNHDGRRSRRRKRSTESAKSAEEQPREHRRRRKRRHHHPDNRPRNPTLAQIGGLPAPRQDKPPGP